MNINEIEQLILEQKKDILILIENLHIRRIKSSIKIKAILKDHNLENLNFCETVRTIDQLEKFILDKEYENSFFGYLFNLNGFYNSLVLYYNNDIDSKHFINRKHYNSGESFKNFQKDDVLLKAINEIRTHYQQRVQYEKQQMKKYRLLKSQLKRLYKLTD